MEVLDQVPHRNTYGQNISWVVQEIPAEWLPMHHTELETKIVILGIQCLQQLQLVSFHAKTAQNVPDTWMRHPQVLAHTMCWLLRAPDKSFSHTLDSLSQWTQPACCFTAHRQPLSAGISCITQELLSIGGSVWYLVQNLCYTITTDSVLANSKTQNAFLSLDLAMFRHDCPLAVKSASMPWYLLPKQTWGDSLPTDILLSAVSGLLCCRVRKFRTYLWIVMYLHGLN
jgi:hypothetical protein